MAERITVGIRELRQNLSVYLRRISDGERFEVTDRGRSVALLIPLPESTSPLDRLVAEGRAAPPRTAFAELGPPMGAASTKVSDALQRGREERL